MTAGRRALIFVAVLLAIALGLPGVSAVREASAQSIQVLSANPSSAEQGTLSLAVTIKGNGFKKGAKAKFYLPNTTNPGGITVSSTRFVDSTQLVATMDVADTAVVSGFDIVVTNTDGRTGKGTELFTVTAKGGSDELSAEFQDAAEDMFRSDGRGIYASAQDNGGFVLFSHPDGSIDFSEDLSISGRSVTFEFGPDNRVRNAVDNGTVQCREYLGDAFAQPEAAPAWLTAGLLPIVSRFVVRTYKLAVPPEVNGAGVWTFSERAFNVQDMAIGDTRIVVVQLSFRDDGGRQFHVRMNQNFYSYPAPELQSVSGFANVTRENESTWVLRPLGADDPRPAGVLNQANLDMSVPEVRKVRSGGYCDLGDWLMPFKITFKSVR